MGFYGMLARLGPHYVQRLGSGPNNMLGLFVCLFVFYGISTFNKLFNAKPIFIQINSFISNNSVEYKYSFCQKQFHFKQFSLA